MKSDFIVISDFIEDSDCEEISGFYLIYHIGSWQLQKLTELH